MRKKILSEQETRRNILDFARTLHCERDIMQIFDKYDRMLKNCTNPMERQAISIAGNEEIHYFLDAKQAGSISVNGHIIDSKK
jgi:hypothetical protein